MAASSALAADLLGSRCAAPAPGAAPARSRPLAEQRRFSRSEEDFWFTRTPEDAWGRSLSQSSLGRPASVPDALCALAETGGGGEAEAESPDGPGTVLGSAVTLVSTCVGTGLLALPFAFACAGPAEGLALLGLFAAWSAAASFLLCQCCEWARCFSYEEVVATAFPGAGGVAMEVVVVWLLLGAMTSLLVVAGDTLERLAALGLQSAAAGAEAHAWRPSRALVLAVDVAAVALPLSWAKSSHALRHSNAAAVSCTALVMAMLFARGVRSASSVAFLEDPGQGRLFQAAPIIMLSMGCQVQVPPVYRELSGRSLRRMLGVLALVAWTCLCMYAAIAVSGLMVAKGECVGGACIGAVPGNVLNSLPESDSGALVMRSVMAAAVTLVYPMLCMPCRSALDHLVCGGVLAQGPEAVRRALETALIGGLTLFFATRGGNLANVFGFTGATAGALICYVMPPACYLRLRMHQPQAERDASAGLAVVCRVMIAAMMPLAASATWSSLA